MDVSSRSCGGDRLARPTPAAPPASVLRRSMATVIGPTPPGHRRDPRGDLGRRREVDVAAERCRRRACGSHVDDHRPRLDPVGRDLLGPAHGDDQDVGLPGDRGRVLGAGVADRDRRVAPLAPSGAAAGPSACRRSATGPAPPRGPRGSRLRHRSGARGSPAACTARTGGTLGQQPELTGWKPSTSLSGSTRSITARSSMPRGKGSWTRMPWTDGSALSRSIVPSSSAWRGLGGQPEDVAVHPGGLAGVLLVADIDLAGRIVAHEHDGQPRDDPRRLAEAGDLVRQLVANPLGQGFSIENGRGHGGDPGSGGLLADAELARQSERQVISGGGGIRTHGTAKRYTGFRDRPFQPLRHPSGRVLSDRSQFRERAGVPGRTD